MAWPSALLCPHHTILFPRLLDSFLRPFSPFGPVFARSLRRRSAVRTSQLLSLARSARSDTFRSPELKVHRRRS
eukprot:2744347-Rhodomonas_salina.1